MTGVAAAEVAAADASGFGAVFDATATGGFFTGAGAGFGEDDSAGIDAFAGGAGGVDGPIDAVGVVDLEISGSLCAVAGTPVAASAGAEVGDALDGVVSATAATVCGMTGTGFWRRSAM